MPVPAHVAWDLFLGPAPERPYNPVYHPHDWRGWWDFGTGSLGDMACHTTNLPFMALKLGLPTRVSAESGEINPETYPAWATITYEFPARGDLPPVKLTWYEGARDGKRHLPPPDLFQGKVPSDSGSLLVGEKGSIFSPSDYGSEQVLLGLERKVRGEAAQAPRPRRRPGSRTASATPTTRPNGSARSAEGSPSIALVEFRLFAAVLTEAMLLGNVAVRLGKPIEYDPATGTVKNSAEAARFVRPEFRKGWTI